MIVTITWIRCGSWYKSADERFSIIRGGLTKRSGWILFDCTRQDECQPQYSWSRHADTIASAKAKAERIVRSGNVAAV